jgi:hypothetical protein
MVRAQQNGYLEAQLAVHFADREPRFRSMAWEADTVYQQWRDLNFGGWREQLEWVGAKTLIVQFGQMESMDGPGKLGDFKKAYAALLDELMQTTPRIVLLSPTLFESHSGSVPHGGQNNDVDAYAAAVKKLADERGLIYVDLIKPMSNQWDLVQYTTNGVHLSDDGHRILGQYIAESLGVPREDETAFKAVQVKLAAERVRMERVRPAIIEKNQLWFENWRPMNWAFAYGDRQHVPFGQAIGDHPPLRVELEQFKPLIAAADEKIHSLAR